MSGLHRRTTMHIGAVLLMTSLASTSAFAVWVNGHPSTEQEYRESDFVFVGRVVAARSVPEGKLLNEGTRYTVRVTEVFRGHPARTLSVFSENSSGRFPMDIGGSYLVFLSREPHLPLTIDNCG